MLCSVDVAVIIFGHNKKLYEYSSGDINETIGRFQYVCLAIQGGAGRLSLGVFVLSPEPEASCLWPSPFSKIWY